MINGRRLGNSGIRVSQVGFGAWAIGGSTPGATSYGATDDQSSLRALRRALDCGITFYDTAYVYGYGHSEELIGQAFAGPDRDRVVIATKAGLFTYGEPVDFTPAALRRSLETSLRRLRTDRVDLFQLHNPSIELLRDQAEELIGLAEDLKADGLIRAFGISVRSPQEGVFAIERYRPAAIQTNFNMLDQRCIDSGLFEAAEAADTAVVARTPLSFGFLAGTLTVDSVFPPDDHRSRWPRDQIARWVTGADALLATRQDAAGQTPSQYALRYCLSFPAVAAVIPGILSEAEADANAAAGRLPPLSAAELAAIRNVYRGLDLLGTKPADPGRVDAAGRAR